MHLMYLLSIAAARASIDMAMAYFVPDQIALDALVAALKRGVKVSHHAGKITDATRVRRASRALWGPILQAGAEIYEYRPRCTTARFWWWTGSDLGGLDQFRQPSFRLNDGRT